LVVPDSVGLSVRELGGRIHQSTRVELFEVTSKGPGLTNQSGVQEIAFEMALV
jgi:hypothetical protein